ncbi:hypothetical protein [uncultured Campylobacter sp.]|uniref:hypothetical protein n=1 Tax=uncultured Campylobacter sp. TaxID=218934 RepID=UPI0026076F2F|nr:hypothetical protein [uncultured Campylobacter sp.]
MKKFIFALFGVFICSAALAGDAERCKVLADAVNGRSHPETEDIKLGAPTCEGDKFVIPTILKNEIWDKVDPKIKQNFERVLRADRQKDVCATMKAVGLKRIGVREFLQSGEKIADLTYTRSDCGLE